MIDRALRTVAVPVAVAAAGYRARSLSGDGAITAAAVGSAIGGATSWPGLVVLGTFFVSSSALSKLLPAPETSGKGSRRDAFQVLANGGIAAVAALALAGARKGSAMAAVAGSLAAATADTWATEIGRTSSQRPRLLVSRRHVEPGESGGVTVRGLLASAGGSALLALTAGAVSGNVSARNIAGSTFVAGIAGSLVDSLAGELVQERRFCDACQARTEARIHRCGTETRYLSGIAGVTNDAVNLLCTLTGGVVGLVLFRR